MPRNNVVRVARNKNYWQVRPLAEGGVGEFAPVHARHYDICNDYIRPKRAIAEHFQGIRSILKYGHAIAEFSKSMCYEVANTLIIFDQNNVFGAGQS